NRIGLNDYFDVMIDGNRISKPKPDPEIFLTAAKLANSRTQNCAVFEDAFSGISAAKDAGMLAIGIGNKEILHNSDYVFENLGQISNQFLESL
ncbi:MAG: HAD-IA family hydrolase, partial [Weeksellaceae bacterium]|nr:HAD-IA family hydrolase [Weeksellaceae bacterium]